MFSLHLHDIAPGYVHKKATKLDCPDGGESDLEGDPGTIVIENETAEVEKVCCHSAARHKTHPQHQVIDLRVPRVGRRHRSLDLPAAVGNDNGSGSLEHGTGDDGAVALGDNLVGLPHHPQHKTNLAATERGRTLLSTL